MKIEDNVEDAVRNAFTAVVDKNADGIGTALRPLSADKATTAVGYAAFVVGYVVRDVLNDKVTKPELNEFAADIAADLRTWYPHGTDVAALLTACVSGDPSGISEDAAVDVFAVGGHLLSRYRPENTRWFEYLDAIWDAAEAASETT